jgi:hypothetical protein
VGDPTPLIGPKLTAVLRCVGRHRAGASFGE